jgi:succinate dehydrogenase/fumarate reductase flavoprotein subunit
MREGQRSVSRREFVKKTAAIGAAAVSAGMLGACTPEAAEAGTDGAFAGSIKWDYEVDFVIVGYGGGGMTASIRAQQAGANFLVLEKDEIARGGNSGCTGGFTIGKDAESGFGYFKSLCRGVTPDDVLMAHCEGFQKFPEFANNLGIEPVYKSFNFVYPSVPGATDFGDKDSHASYALYEVGGKASDTWFRFRDAAVEMGISVDDGNVLVATPAIRLIQNPDTKEIIGVKAMKGVTFEKDFSSYSGGTEINIMAKKAVLLCCGGYENNEEIRANFGAHPHGSQVTFYGTPMNTGDGIKMAVDVGAKLWHMNKKEVHALANAQASKELGVGLVVDAYEVKGHEDAPLTKSSFFINRFGKRFQNESFYHGHTDRTQQWDRFVHVHGDADENIDFWDQVGPEFADYINLPFYWVFDQKMMEGDVLASDHEELYRFALQNKLYEPIEGNANQDWVDRGWVVKGDTAEELASKLVAVDYWGRTVGVDPAGLAETLKNFNEYAAAGVDPEFHRPAGTMEPLTGPFYAMELIECQTNTDGGPERNGNCQTMNMYGEPIPRLYNCGECGSIWGAMYNGGGNIPETYATGVMAMEHALTLDPWN